MCEIGLLSSVPNAWEKYTIIMLYLQGSRRMDQRKMTSALFSHSMVECMQTFEL